MSAIAATLLLESRNHAALSQYKRILSILTNGPSALRTGLEIMVLMELLGRNLRKGVQILHSPILERAPSELLLELSADLEKMHESHVDLLKQIEVSSSLGYWRGPFLRAMKTLMKYDVEIVAHSHAFRRADETLMILSRRDQETIAKLLLRPPEPNEKLRLALERHTMPGCSSARKGSA